jgi:class 3 adenylate cyclase
LLTSKEILERTGISRATLNNYIAAGLVARPDVLPPAPDDGAAPRIGYFPDDTLERIRTIQRLKRQGWSIGRIAEHFARGGAAAPASQHPEPGPAPAVPVAPVPSQAPGLRLQLLDTGSPAYLVDERFALAWLNPACASHPMSPVPGLRAGDAVLAHLLASNAPGAHATLRFHLAVAKERGLSAAQLASGLAGEDAARLAQLYEEVRATGAMPVGHVSLAATGGLPLRLGFAVHFREHVLFAYTQGAGAGPAPTRPPAQAPALTSVAILVATLQDANGLWARLSPQEYFELANELWAEVEAVFRRHRAVLGRHPGEGLVCYFLREPGEAHLSNALAAARAAKEAMRILSHRWAQRKRWDVEVALNIGVDEGQEWIGAIGADEFRVLGEAADRAEHLSRCGRAGTLYATRGFIGKLPAAARGPLEFAAPRAQPGTRPTPHTFAPLVTVCPSVPPRLAEVAVAEILDPPAPAA